MNTFITVKNYLFILILSTGLFGFEAVKAQTVSVPMQYYDRVQGIRDKASDLYDKKNATQEEIVKGTQMLKNAISFLDSIPVAEYAEGNIYLKGRRHDVYMDMAGAYSIAHKNDSAFWALDRMYSQGVYGSVPRYLEKDSMFMNIRSDARFDKFIARYRSINDLYNGAAFKTPYKPNLSEEEKIAGLSLLWMQARLNFVYFDHLKSDWNQTYIDYLGKVKDTKNTAEYYKVLMRFYAELHDGHTNAYPPDELDTLFYSRPPMRTELIEGRVFIRSVTNDSLLNAGIKPGLEILKIDGIPVKQYAEEYVKPYCSSSTPQDLEVREFTYALLAGAASKPIHFEFRDVKGKVFTQTVARAGYHNNKGTGSVVYRDINGIGYLQVNEFESNKVVKQVDSLFKNEIGKTHALIIDVRNNGGGSSGIGYNIIRKLTDKPFATSASKVIKYYSRPGAALQWDDNSAGEWSPDGKIFYNKPVVVLIGPKTFSAAEDFVVAFDYLKRGKLVGMKTGGSTGQPVSFDLPGGGSARVCGKRDTYPDGKEFVGIGITPDVVVAPTIKGLLSDKDEALDKALEILK